MNPNKDYLLSDKKRLLIAKNKYLLANGVCRCFACSALNNTRTSFVTDNLVRVEPMLTCKSTGVNRFHHGHASNSKANETNKFCDQLYLIPPWSSNVSQGPNYLITNINLSHRPQSDALNFQRNTPSAFTSSA